ncbi:calaxin [Eupeodes corollae]|uniref:calaxin n=1 Tax=Eupeodes corollae TaxID=290404 RepID=UPI0024909BD5|nr:calaxin [Eupeodes corollae]
MKSKVTAAAVGARAKSVSTPITTRGKATQQQQEQQPSPHSLQANKTILRSISIFLASGKRNSHQSRNTSGSTRKRTGKMELNGKSNPKLLESLRRKTRFSKDEIDALYRIYRKLVSNCQYAAKALAANSSSSVIAKPHSTVEGIDRIIFRELLHSTFDIVTEEILMERIFCSWDKTHEGLPLRLEGWLTGLSVFLRGNKAEKAAFCFRVYDLNADGFITKDEMFTLLKNCLIKQPQDEDPDEGVKDLVEIVLRKFDVDKDGKVSFDDFLATINAQPLLIEAFGQCLPTENAIVSFFSTLQI